MSNAGVDSAARELARIGSAIAEIEQRGNARFGAFEAMFALAMFHIGGRGGLKDRAEAARLLAEACGA